ncbi:hypothetical protein AB0F17_64300 [Nonomuraea sp. NPDC026600]|uniref:hypothetical protein n=1 Tax=Nonomuraea sp. NPDC026600 TaxID=3155363 RepID=UPI0033FE2E74
MFGRDGETWDLLVEKGLEFLIEQARLERTTTYTELNAVLARRTGLREFDFSRQDERAAMGHLLGLIVEKNLPEVGFMISALVQYLDVNDAGPGFYHLATEKELLPHRASRNVKTDFWVSQVSAAYRRYGRAPRP